MLSWSKDQLRVTAGPQCLRRAIICCSSLAVPTAMAASTPKAWLHISRPLIERFAGARSCASQKSGVAVQAVAAFTTWMEMLHRRMVRTYPSCCAPFASGWCYFTAQNRANLECTTLLSTVTLLLFQNHTRSTVSRYLIDKAHLAPSVLFDSLPVSFQVQHGFDSFNSDIVEVLYAQSLFPA